MENKVKVIHIVESLHKGAVENWLVRMFLYGQKNGENLDWTFYCTEDFEGRLEQKVIEYGGKIIKSPSKWSQPIKFIKDLKRELKSAGYSVIHCHHDLMSALYLIASIGVRCDKIVHVHNMDEHVPTKSKLKAKLLRFLFKRICWLLAYKIVGISNHTLDKFISYRKRNNKRHKILYYGINHLSFLNAEDNQLKFREEFGIPKDRKVLLFCARIDPAKNPIQALKIFKNLLERGESYFLLIVGKGGLVNEVNDYIEMNKLSKHVKYEGWSDEIPFILKNADLLLYPHQEYPLEGLGIIIVEAQLAGLPILSSIGVSKDPFFMDTNLRLSLNDSLDVWSDAAFKMCSIQKNNKETILEKYSNSPFLMNTAFTNLQKLYYSHEEA